MAALGELTDYETLVDKPVLHSNPRQFQVSTVQEWWVKVRMGNLAPGQSPPRIFARVRWNWGVLARVYCGHYVSSSNAEKRDSLYMWFFGTWVRLHDYTHMMGEAESGKADRIPAP
jgi:hypothetical protein